MHLWTWKLRHEIVIKLKVFVGLKSSSAPKRYIYICRYWRESKILSQAFGGTLSWGIAIWGNGDKCHWLVFDDTRKMKIDMGLVVFYLFHIEILVEWNEWYPSTSISFDADMSQTNSSFMCWFHRFFNQIMHVNRLCDLVTVNFVYLYFTENINRLTVWPMTGWNFWERYRKIWNLLFSLGDFQRIWIKIDDWMGEIFTLWV